MLIVDIIINVIVIVIVIITIVIVFISADLKKMNKQRRTRFPEKLTVKKTINSKKYG